MRTRYVAPLFVLCFLVFSPVAHAAEAYFPASDIPPTLLSAAS